MPNLDKVLREEDLKRGGAGGGGLDLTPYLAMIAAVRAEGGVGGLITLEEGERQRTEKRRMSVAAKDQGYTLVWRTAPERRLRFVLATPGEPIPASLQSKAIGHIFRQRGTYGPASLSKGHFFGHGAPWVRSTA